jgi:hypothetical protein
MGSVFRISAASAKRHCINRNFGDGLEYRAASAIKDAYTVGDERVMLPVAYVNADERQRLIEVLQGAGYEVGVQPGEKSLLISWEHVQDLREGWDR